MVTGLYAGILGVIYIGLSFMVIRKRLKNQIGVGHNKNEPLMRAIRVHANFAEYVPLALILMAIVELNSLNPFEAAPLYLHGLGITLVLARVGHAYGLTKSIGTSPGRFGGTLATFGVLIILSVLAIIQFATA